MTVKQISIFLENRPGRLSELTGLLEQNQLNLRALSLAETTDFGILRIIVSDPYQAVTVLQEAGYVCSVTKVLAVELPDRPGGLFDVLRVLGEGGVNLEYTYAFTARQKGAACLILRVADNDAAIEVLGKNGVRPLCQEELNDLFDD